MRHCRQFYARLGFCQGFGGKSGFVIGYLPTQFDIIRVISKGEQIMAYTQFKIPAGGEKITNKSGKRQVPDNPIIPFVEGDGTGRDIWRASVRVFDAAVPKAYGGKR